MTVIVGWWSENGGALAADRATEKNGKSRLLNRPKIRAIPRADGGHVMFGFTGYGHHALFWDAIVGVSPIGGEGPSLVEWWRVVLNDFGTWLRERGDGSAEDGVWSAPWHGLCLAKEGLFELYPQGDVTRADPRKVDAGDVTYAAVGSGAEVAMGALYVSSRMSFAYQDRLTLAVEAANEEAAGCGFGVDMLVESWPVSKS